MTAPVAAQQDLLALLNLVDGSRSRALALEEQFRADMATLYAERVAALTAERAQDEAAEVLNAAFLTSLVLLIRRALSAGAEEGGRFATAQFAALGLPAVLLDEIEIPLTDLGDKLVRDFLDGQVAVVRMNGSLPQMFAELQRRGQLAIVSAVQSGRGAATEAAFSAVTALVETPLHKLWVARFDLATPPCKLCVRLHGQHVPLGESFTALASEPAPYLGALSAPPRHPHCRCSLVLYVPGTLESAAEGVTPLSMRAYASWALSLSAQDREEYLAATVVHVKAYTRMVDGKMQHVSGYYYDIQTGQKIPEGQWSGASVKQVSAQQARQITQSSKAANKSTPKGGDPDLDWKPGTYRLDVPNSTDDTQVIVHQDGSSTSIHKGQVAEADKAQTAQFLSMYQQHGLVQKVSDDPEAPDRAGPGPQLEPSDEDKQGATLADGHYVFENHPTYGGVHVKPDGTGELYFKDFKKKLPLKEIAISQIAKGNLGEFEEVEEKDFTEDWHKQFQQSKAGGAKPPRQGSSEPSQNQQPSASGPQQAQQPNAQRTPGDNAAPGVNVPGVATRAGQQQGASGQPTEPGDRTDVPPGTGGSPDFASIPDVSLPGEPPVLENQTGAGVVVVEPDGSIWIYEPKGHYAGYKNTFPKGGLEDGLSVQQNAHKELWEETGITADITGYLGDYRHGKHNSGGRVRMYVAVRKGGEPKPDDSSPYVKGGNEAAAVKNVSPEEAAKLLNVNRDKRILKDLNQFGTQGRPPAQPGENVPGQQGGAGQQSANAPAVNAPNAPRGGLDTSQLRSELNERRATGRTRTLDEALDEVARPANAGRSPGDSVSSSEQQDIPEAPEGGPGGVVKGGPSLFPVGQHSVQVEEGSQVYRSSKSKDTLYVLQPNGDLIKYNPQGAGVQATKVGSSENPSARAQQLAKLDNVTDDLGVSIKNTMPAPGTGKTLVGGFEMTSKQLDDAIAALSSNPSGNVAGDLKKAGSPLAAGKFHEVAAPYKAYYNNKTKPALIAALKKAQALTGSTPDAAAPAVAHLAEAHGLEEHHASLGHADTEAIHAALHAVDPQGSDHSHANDGPGFISIAGAPFPPAAVAQALDALKKSPSKETGVKKPLKAAGSPMANLDLQSLANNSQITQQYKGSNGKVHYGKLKPAVIALLTDALDKHQTSNPPTPAPAAVVPEPVRSISGVSATQAQILEMQQFFDSVDLDDPNSAPFEELQRLSHNPLALGVDWDDFIESKGGPDVQLNEANQVLHDALNSYLDTKTRFMPTSAPQKPEDTSPELKIGGKTGTVNQLIAYKNALHRMTGFGSLFGKLPPDNAFAEYGLDAMAGFYGLPDDMYFPALKQALSDELQKKIDQSLLKKSLPPPTKPDAPLSTISVGGTQVTKADLLAAVEAVKNSPSTGVKGPLKAIDSPLSKVDVKAYIEADSLSDPYKGSNGKVHYGKLKDAVAAVLQAKADQMGDPELPADPSVTSAGDATPEVDAPSVEAPVPGAPDAPSRPAPGAPSFQSVDPVDDFFSDGVPTTPSSGEQTPAQKLKQALENAEAGVDVPPLDNSFAAAFQQAVKTGDTYFTDEDEWSSVETDFEGSWYYEISPSGTVYELDEDGNAKKLSDQQILNQIDGAFDQVGGSLEEATAAADPADPGFYTSAAAGISIKVYADGSGLVTNLSSGEKVNVDAPASVKAMLDSGGWTKVSDSPDEVGKAHVEGVEVGYYAVSTPSGEGVSATLYPDGTVLASSAYGDAVMDAKTAKPYVLAMGSAPQSIPLGLPDWVANVPKGPGGFAQGEYDSGFGEVITVDENSIKTNYDTDALSADFLASIVFSGDVTYKPPLSALGLPPAPDGGAPDAGGPGVGVPGEPPGDAGVSAEQGSKLDALVAKAKAASDLDDGVSGSSSNLSKAFQKAAKTGDTYYSSPHGVFTSPPSTAYVKATPDGILAVHAAGGGLLAEWSEDDILQALDRVFEGPAVLDPVPPPPATSSSVFPDGTWQGHPLGTYTNGESQFLEIDVDGPRLSFEDIQDGLDEDAVLDMIESGDMTFVPSPDSPAPSTPSQHVDPDAPKLQPFMVAGYTNMTWTDKPVLLAAAKKWAQEAGLEGVAAQHLNASTTKDDLVAWLDHWAKGEWDKAYEIEAKKVKNHKTKAQHPGSPDNPANAGGFTKKKMPPLVEGELPAGVVPDGQWPAAGSWSSWEADQVDAYLLAANMQNPTGLHSGQKKKWAIAHRSGDKISTDSLSNLGQKNVGEGQHYSSPILPSVDKYAPGQAVPLPADFPEIDHSKTSAQGWTNQQLDQYLNHVGPTKKVVDFLAKQKSETKAALVSLHAVSAAPSGSTTFKDPTEAKKQFEDLLKKVSELSSWNEEETTSFIHDVLKVDGKTFTKNKEQPPLGGGSSSTITQVTDENGNQFLHKAYPEKFRVDVEHAGHELAQLAGVKVADSMVGTFEGKYGQFQARVPSKGTLQGVAPTDLPLSALKDLMVAHVQDWATSNDDAHADNFLLMPDGKNVMPIDIARSFARFGNPHGMQLKVGQLSDWTTPYYDKVYKAALSKKLSDADVDELYRASVGQAQRTANVADADWAGVIERGLKDRTNWGSTSAKNLKELTQQALARKNALPEDFEKFWDGIYSQLGREKPEPQAGLSKWTYSGVSQEYLQHAEAMGNQGAATFFGGSALEDGHLLAQVFGKAQGDGQELHLSGQLRKDADKTLRDWLEARVTEVVSSSPQSKEEMLKQTTLMGLGVFEYPTQIVAAAKTVSHHHKQGDKDYNTQHMANFSTLEADLKKKLDDFEAGNLPSIVVSNMALKDEYGNLLRYYSGQVAKVQEMIDLGGQSKVGDFDPYNFKMPGNPIVSPDVTNDGIKVKKLPSYFEDADLGDDGKLKLTGNQTTTGQSGTTYQVTLSDGTQIEYRSWHSSDGVRKSQQGQLKVKVRDYDGTTAGTQSAMSALSKMGLDLKDASEEDMELLYWRHLYGVLSDRKDSNVGKMKEVVDEVKATLPGGGEGTPALSAKEELDRWRSAWSRLDPTKFNTFLAGKKWLPRFNRASVNASDLRGGQPFWMRFDVSYDDLKNKDFPAHSLYDPGVASTLVKSGGLFSTEDRYKLLGKWSGGMSSTSDQAYGSAGFVFTRINTSGNYQQVLLNPAVLARTSNYAYDGDNFGDADQRKTSAFFDFNSATGHMSGSNETLIKHSVSLLDDIELLVFSSQAQRQEAIQYLKDRGITHIRGLLVEDRLVLESNRAEALEKIKKHRQTWVPGEEEF